MIPVRHLNLHEYQSKALMAEHGIDVQKFYVTESPSEVSQLVNKLSQCFKHLILFTVVNYQIVQR